MTASICFPVHLQDSHRSPGSSALQSSTWRGLERPCLTGTKISASQQSRSGVVTPDDNQYCTTLMVSVIRAIACRRSFNAGRFSSRCIGRLYRTICRPIHRCSRQPKHSEVVGILLCDPVQGCFCNGTNIILQQNLDWHIKHIESLKAWLLPSKEH